MAWLPCTAGWGGGFYDPPKTLHPANILVPTTIPTLGLPTLLPSPGQSIPYIASPTSDPSDPSRTSDTSDPAKIADPSDPPKTSIPEHVSSTLLPANSIASFSNAGLNAKSWVLVTVIVPIESRPSESNAVVTPPSPAPSQAPEPPEDVAFSGLTPLVVTLTDDGRHSGPNTLTVLPFVMSGRTRHHRRKSYINVWWRDYYQWLYFHQVQWRAICG